MNLLRIATRALCVASVLLPAVLLAQTPPIQVVLFTHIEDNTPGGTLGSAQNRQSYLMWRARLINVANLMRDSAVPWSLQPDWKILQCALLYEDATLMQSTNGKNFLRYLKEDLGVHIDPHSHENGGYNYTDVAHLIDSLDVGTTTVIGGHIWDPSDPLFAEWDRFRVPVNGQRFPWATWRGDILMGSGTPNHVNDPLVSGVWRPQDRDHYFTHDPNGNIAAVGQFKGTIEDIPELTALYQSGIVSTQYMLTSTYAIRPAVIQRPDGLVSIQDSVITPIVAWRGAGNVNPTDFTTLVQTWMNAFGSRGYLYDAENPPTDAGDFDLLPAVAILESCAPNPFASATALRFKVDRATHIHLGIYDVLGRKVATLVDGTKQPGRYTASWTSHTAPSGVYFCRLRTSAARGVHVDGKQEKKLLLLR